MKTQNEKHKPKSNRISLGEYLHNLKIGGGNLRNTENLDSIRGKTNTFDYRKLKCKNILQNIFAIFWTEKLFSLMYKEPLWLTRTTNRNVSEVYNWARHGRGNENGQEMFKNLQTLYSTGTTTYINMIAFFTNHTGKS